MIYCKSPITNRSPARLLIIGCWLIVALLCGCASIGGGIRSVAGCSTREVENSRGKSIKKVFKYDYFTCYAKVRGALTDIGAYIYAEDKKKDLIAIYVSEKDTTPVGLFFQEIDSFHTQIEISSPSSFARDLIAERIFSKLEVSSSRNEKEK